jgi:two-component sensor histidine kinase
MASRGRSSFGAVERAPFSYLFAIAITLFAAAVRLMLGDRLVGVQFVTIFPAIIAAAYVGGTRPALVSAAVGALVGWYFFIPPHGSFVFPEPRHLLTLIFYATVAVLIAVPVGRLRAAQLAAAEGERRQTLLAAELNHRVKNTLAVVQSVAHQSFPSEEVGPEPRQRFEQRLAALAAAHDVLTRENWEPTQLSSIIEAAAHAYAGDFRISIAGPEVLVRPQAAVTVAMAIHELCANAAKYGALSVPEGRVNVSWSVDERERRLELRWQESGGPPVEPPATRGFGSRMIERALAGELRGRSAIHFRPDGVVCEISAEVAPAYTGEAAWEI